MDVKKVLGIAATGIAGTLFLLTRKYGALWFRTRSDDELREEREKVRQEYCSSGKDYQLGVWLQELLYLFDDEMRRRSSSGDEGFPAHSEHGWYLED